MAHDVPVALLLERAGRALAERLQSSFGTASVTPDHWRVLRLLSDEKGRTMGWMAEQLGMNPPTLTKLVDRMVAQSLVQRGADPEDSRRVLLFATDAGLGLLGRLQQRVARHEVEVAAILGPRNAKHLERLLLQLIENRHLLDRHPGPPIDLDRGRTVQPRH